MDPNDKRSPDIIALFDVNGTLTAPRLSATKEMIDFLAKLGEKFMIGIAGGSDLLKQKEQFGGNVSDMSHYNFSDNGLVAYRGKKLLAEASLTAHLGEKHFQKLINYCLGYTSALSIPVKSGTFMEFRKGI
ncbi:Phosphomannomutase 2 [Gracilariopsis chorda]|uniref:Phosphomannomutase n=1 Tax=Gracilariopsis chorda TaxID=448386 RepID=A0A2V3ICR7_9FLOR|nr:Phosphomannomutase 2 [Gracilariopsis chorda]|eukprot:PXF39885.1 Phosphomannomutase 2 [Gracilariopsis chorda]